MYRKFPVSHRSAAAAVRDFSPNPAIYADAVSPLRGKRLFDVVAGLVLGVVTLPLQLIALLASAMAFRAFPVFSQERVGCHGRRFVIRKIRSLPVSTAPAADKYALDEGANHWVGRVLRKTHLDETIQFWAVVAGSLSLVGPRPEMVGLSNTYDPGFVSLRTSVTPGVTGLWQVSDASDMLIGESPEYDIAYVLHRSWSLEFRIMWATVGKMAGGQTIDAETLIDLVEDTVSLPGTNPGLRAAA